jgi:hypothetical protein
MKPIKVATEESHIRVRKGVEEKRLSVISGNLTIFHNIIRLCKIIAPETSDANPEMHDAYVEFAFVCFSERICTEKNAIFCTPLEHFSI